MSIPILDLVPYAIAVLSMAGSVGLFVALKVEMRRQTLKAGRASRELANQCAMLQSSLDDMRRQIPELPQANWDPVPAAAPRPSLNMSHRAQALRMSRRGEGPGQIAAALGVPAAEVELLLKVHLATAAARV